MSNRLVFATHNQNKLTEVNKLIDSSIKLLSLNDIDFHDEIPETGDTLEENAMIKADTVFQFSGISCFADDTGLIVDCLNGEPGVQSARYAGEECNSDDNIDKLLSSMQDSRNRKAHFKTVIHLIWNREHFVFNGLSRGVITEGRRGSKGFGYDPVFLPENSPHTFGEMSLTEKNKISHRYKAVKKLADFLDGLLNKQ